MRLSQRLSQFARETLARAESRGGQDDRYLAGDPLIRPWGMLAKEEAELRELQDQSLRAVYATEKGGKIVLVPREEQSFQAISAEMSALGAKVTHNREVLQRLELAVTDLHLEEFSLRKLHSAIDDRKQRQQYVKAHALDDVMDIWEAAVTLGDRSLAEEHPEVVAARQKAAAEIEVLQGEIDTLQGKIDVAEAILRELRW